MKQQSRPPRALKQLTAIQTSRHFRVSHRQHSGRLLPRQHTSYPILLMIVLCVGVLLLGWTDFVTAETFPGPIQDSYSVHLRVPGPAPTVAASINSPTEGDVFTDVPITVSGDCPLNTYVSLMRNGVYSGTGLCQINGTYSIKTGLFNGVNQLRTQVYSQTDTPGPLSNIVNVAYTPPIISSPTPTPDQPAAVGDSSPKSAAKAAPRHSGATVAPSAATATVPLLFKANFNYQGVYTGEPTDWNLAIDGGTAPYAISVDWGDGSNSVISHAKAGAFSLQHSYKKAGGYKGSYVVIFTASDANGTKTYLQLLTIVNDPLNSALIGANHGGHGLSLHGVAPGYLQKIVGFIWPSYGVVMVMLVSFWLGERRELSLLQAQHTAHRTKAKHL